MPLFTIVSPTGEQWGTIIVPSQQAAQASLQPGQRVVLGRAPSPEHVYVNGKWVLPA